MTAPRCHVEPLLRGWVDDELSETESALVERHVGRCPGCAAQLAAYAERCDEMYALAEAIELELHADIDAVTATPSPRRFAWPRWSRLQQVRLRWSRWSWPSMVVAAGLVLGVCDRAAMQEAIDAATVAPGSTPSLAAGAASIDETRPTCEESTWLGSDAFDEGPVCADQLVTLALASFPESSAGDGDGFGWSSSDGDSDEPICHPDDGGDLVCMPDEPV